MIMTWGSTRTTAWYEAKVELNLVRNHAKPIRDIILPAQRLHGQGPVERLVGDRGNLSTCRLDFLPESVSDPTPPDVDDQDHYQPDHSAQPQPGVDERDHRRAPEQEKGDAGSVGKGSENSGSLVDVGVGHRQQVPHRLTVEPGHPQGQLMGEEVVSHVLAGPELKPTRRSAAEDDGRCLEDRHCQDRPGCRENQPFRVDSLVEDGDDETVGDPTDHPS
jgi:hypothetical protein